MASDCDVWRWCLRFVLGVLMGRVDVFLRYCCLLIVLLLFAVRLVRLAFLLRVDLSCVMRVCLLLFAVLLSWFCRSCATLVVILMVACLLFAFWEAKENQGKQQQCVDQRAIEETTGGTGRHGKPRVGPPT